MVSKKIEFLVLKNWFLVLKKIGSWFWTDVSVDWFHSILFTDIPILHISYQFFITKKKYMLLP